MKLLFVDIDGVLNCNRSFDDYVEAKARGERLAQCQSYYFAPWSVKALNRISDETGAKVGISGSWRDCMPVVFERFAHFGITGKIIGHTPLGEQIRKSGLYVATHRNRGEQIDEFLRDYARRQFERKRFWRADYVSHFAILDDEDVDSGDDSKPHAPFMVRTEWEHDGLTDALADDAIALLKRPQELSSRGLTPATLIITKILIRMLVKGTLGEPLHRHKYIAAHRDHQRKLIEGMEHEQ